MIGGTTEAYLRFTTVLDVRESDRGLVAHLHGERLRLDVVRADVLRISMSRGGQFEQRPTYAVCVDPLSSAVPFEVEQGDDVVRLRTPELVASLWLSPFRLDVHRADGSTVIETAMDAHGRYGTYATLNDAFVVRRRCRPDDPVYGLGEKSGSQNRRGRDFTLWNTDVLDPKASGEFARTHSADDPRADNRGTQFDPYYVSIPFFYHQDAATGAMAASFVDNSHRADYDFTGSQEYAFHFDGGQYTEYVFAGPGMAQILEAYTWLTGRTAPPPLWALGYHQCRWFAYTQDAVEALAARYRTEAIPCDALWLDIDHMDGYRVFTWNSDAFPDVPRMLARLSDAGFRMVTIVDPGIKHDPGYWVYDQALERDVLCRTEGGDVYVGQVWPGSTAFPDFVTEEGRAWWGELNAAHVASGLAGVWNDMNEPATGVIAPDRMRFDHGHAPHERYHNQYALLMAMGTTQGLLAARPEERTFVLSRAGFAGIQRYAANWMGDNMSRWDHLWLSMPMAAGLGISGQAFVGADIGGFMGDTDPELFLRWMQHGALTPFCRNHSSVGNVDQYPWSFGPAVRDLVREALRLRYRLLPYLYACFLHAAETGAPVQRPLVFDFQDDPAVRDIDDEYLLGPDILVAPVSEAAATTRQVYLPSGDWYDWHTGDVHRGRQALVAPTPLDRIPIYARAGAVIPMWPEAPASTAGFRPREVELHAFLPTRDGQWTSLLQEDDGRTHAAHDGARHRTTLTVTRAGERVTIAADVVGDGYPEHAREALHLVLHGAPAARVHVDDVDHPVHERRVVLENAAQPFVVRLQLAR